MLWNFENRIENISSYLLRIILRLLFMKAAYLCLVRSHQTNAFFLIYILKCFRNAFKKVKKIITWLAVREKRALVKTASKNYRKNPTNTNALKLKTAQYQLAGIYIKEQTEYIQIQIDKIRDSVEDRQSRIAWQTINEVSRRKNTAEAKLKAANQQERIKLWKQHFENLLGNPPKITHEPITRIISKQLDIN